MLRLFTCVWIPNDIKVKIEKLQKELMKQPIKAKFVELENLHFTVTFLGDIKEKDVNMLETKLNSSVKNVKSFHVKLEGLKIIPNEDFIRVIGVNIKDEGRNVSNLIKEVGKSIDGKYYETAKLTLCRVKKVYDKHSLKGFIEKNRNVEIGIFEVKNVSLVKSTLTRKGPIYETIHESVLGN